MPADSGSDSAATASTTMTASLTGLKPPEPLIELTMESYVKWKQRFELYRIASSADKQENKVQLALLLHCMGEQCLDIYNTFVLEDAQRNYDAVIKKFDEYFIPTKNESFYSHLFFTRNQRSDESFDAYLTELRKLSNDCNFKDLQDRLIRDRIVAGISDKVLKNRLLRECDLDLSKTIKICKAAELAEAQIKKFEANTEVSVVHKKLISPNNNKTRNSKQDGSRSSGRSSNQQRPPASNSDSAPTPANSASGGRNPCKRCGYIHKWKNCPAFGKTCAACGKQNHFAKMCSKRQGIKIVQVNDNEIEDNFDGYVIDIINVHSIHAKKDWVQHVKLIDFKDKNIPFRLDTGAQCNVISIDMCKKLGIRTIESSNLKLMNYAREKINTIGKVNLNCKVGNLIKKCQI